MDFTISGTTVYSETVKNELTMGSASLVVVKRKSGTHTLVAYLPADCPEVFVNGTIDECRAKWNQAKAFVRKYMGV